MFNSQHYALCFLLQSLISLVRYSEAVGLLVKPRNVATTVGTSATFECMSANNASVAWYFGSTAISINAQIAKADVYSIMPSSDPGRYNLAVLNPTFSKQGTYKCQLFIDETIHSSAELIVLESSPQLSHNVTSGGAMAGEVVRLTCNITYQGLWGPSMSWTRDSVALNAVRESTVGSLSMSQYSVYITTTPDDNGKVFACRTYFDTVTITEANRALNSPDYTAVTLPYILTVLYPPQNFVISPPNLHGSVYYPSAQFFCSASANPSLVPMSYTWTVTTANNTLTINGPILQLTTSMVGSVTAQCQAFNTIRGTRRVSTSSSYTFTVLAPTTTTQRTTESTTTADSRATVDQFASSGEGSSSAAVLSGGAIAGIVIACIVVVALVILLAIFVVCRRASRVPKGEKQQRVGQFGRSPPREDAYDSSRPVYAADYPPPMYMSSDSGHARNSDGLVYADLAFDDQPRSRKPVQYLAPSSSDSDLHLTQTRY